MTFGSRLMVWMVALAAMVAVLHLPAVASAQDYDEATIAEVNDHFRKGAQLYYDGDYDAAIAEFEAAHAKIPNAIFLYNISLAQTKKGETAKSLETAVAAQQMGGLAPNEQVQNEARIVALRTAANSERTAEEVPRVEPLFRFGLLGWIGSGLVVAGVVGLGGVLIIDRGISADVEAYKAAAARGDTTTYNSLRDELRPRQRAGRALFAVSTLAVLSGAGLLVYDLVLRKDETTVMLTPIRGGLGIALTRRF